MGNIEARAEVGGFFNYLVSKEAYLSPSLRYGSVQDSNGLLADLGLGYSTEPYGDLRLGLGVAATLAHTDYMRLHAVLLRDYGSADCAQRPRQVQAGRWAARRTASGVAGALERVPSKP